MQPHADSLSPALPQMTGRKGRVVSRSDGTVAFESRAEQGLSIDHVNLREKERFMKGEKRKEEQALLLNSYPHVTLHPEQGQINILWRSVS